MNHAAIAQVADGAAPLTIEQVGQAAQDASRQGGAFVDHAGIELHQVCTGTDLVQRIFGTSDAPDSHQRECGSHALPHLRKDGRGQAKERGARQPARFRGMATVGQAVAGKRRVGDDQAIQIVCQGFGGNIIEPFLGQIGSDLQEYGQRAAVSRCLFRTGRKDGFQQRLQAVAGLQVAQAGRVGLGNVAV